MKLIKKAIANIILFVLLPTVGLGSIPIALDKIQIIEEARSNLLSRVQ
ncbi:hypothetical protein [Stenotrophomonas acidaminiphila]